MYKPDFYVDFNEIIDANIVLLSTGDNVSLNKIGNVATRRATSGSRRAF